MIRWPQGFVVSQRCQKVARQNGSRRVSSQAHDELCDIPYTADVKGPDYPWETFRVLKEKEIHEQCKYRTRRLVLAAWDRMESNGEFTAMGM